MSNLMFCLNATMPIFLTMMLGYAFRKWHIMDGSFGDKMNSFVFKVALPVLVFQDLATVDFFEAWDWKFVVFCFLATLISITAVTLLSFLLKDKSLQGEFIQASYRSSAAIFGIAFIQNIYGEAGMGPLMIVASVPLYNIMAVVVLTVMRPPPADQDPGNEHPDNAAGTRQGKRSTDTQNVTRDHHQSDHCRDPDGRCVVCFKTSDAGDP